MNTCGAHFVVRVARIRAKGAGQLQRLIYLAVGNSPREPSLGQRADCRTVELVPRRVEEDSEEWPRPWASVCTSVAVVRAGALVRMRMQMSHTRNLKQWVGHVCSLCKLGHSHALHGVFVQPIMALPGLLNFQTVMENPKFGKCHSHTADKGGKGMAAHHMFTQVGQASTGFTSVCDKSDGLTTWCTVCVVSVGQGQVLQQRISSGVQCCACCSCFKHGCSSGVASRHVSRGCKALPRRRHAKVALKPFG